MRAALATKEQGWEQEQDQEHLFVCGGAHGIRCVRDSFNIESTRRRRRTPAMTDVGDIAAHISAAAPDRKLAGNRRGSGRSLWARRVSNGSWLLSSLPRLDWLQA
jgi:hypothetical protein